MLKLKNKDVKKVKECWGRWPPAGLGKGIVVYLGKVILNYYHFEFRGYALIKFKFQIDKFVKIIAKITTRSTFNLG